MLLVIKINGQATYCLWMLAYGLKKTTWSKMYNKIDEKRSISCNNFVNSMGRSKIYGILQENEAKYRGLI